MSDYRFNSSGQFVLSNYGRCSAFSSFLPGIAGKYGVPAWCNYNNRGQAVCSFGVQDKNHAIMEFTAAHTAYQQVSRMGYRTFVRTDAARFEPFADGSGTMRVEPNVLHISWKGCGVSVNVHYFILPGEPLGGLCRLVELENKSQKELPVEVLDGMAALVPYGVDNAHLKNEANLSKAWMRVEKHNSGCPLFRVCASMADSAKVTAVEGFNFCRAMDDRGTVLPVIVRPESVFAWDTSLQYPIRFFNEGLAGIKETDQIASNLFPCCFVAWHGKLKREESLMLYELYGQSPSADLLDSLLHRIQTPEWFESKLNEARSLAKEVGGSAVCHTSVPVFDAYVLQNQIDNVMRGGQPVRYGKHVTYTYSRKHGDPEREYNDFYMAPEYLSQGNGNFRDICQNRRNDVWLCPPVGDSNIHQFFELLQIDGYNPLEVQPVTYRIRELPSFVAKWHSLPPEAFSALEGTFTVGGLAMKAEVWGVNLDAFLEDALASSRPEYNAELKEGYWCDHWTYLLDLVESYLAVFPDREEQLLFEDKTFRWFTPQAVVMPQEQRYCMTESGLRQYHCVERRPRPEKWMCGAAGEEIRSSLMEKLLLLCAVKFLTLDASGAGIEMEGGKPGWCDAANGLPGLLGSSVADVCELLRLLEFSIEKLDQRAGRIELKKEIADLLQCACENCISGDNEVEKWLERNRIRDHYRQAVYSGLCGRDIVLDDREVVSKLKKLRNALADALQTAVSVNNGICPTYYYYDVLEWKETDTGFLPTKLKRNTLPLFLEGPARWLKTKQPECDRSRQIRAVHNSDLYDRKLSMYKICQSLASTSYEIGRIRAFSPGWLENESIWVHMEYKYLLALLESGSYDVFFRDFHTMAIPFLNAESYGRSTTENSSFIASSAATDMGTHGRGYVARLSGSTAEFISIWQQMLFGKKPFRLTEGQLELSLQPAIPSYLIPEDGTLSAMFLGVTKLTYHLSGVTHLIPEHYHITRYRLQYADGAKEQFEYERLPGVAARRVRAGDVKELHVWIMGEGYNESYSD